MATPVIDWSQVPTNTELIAQEKLKQQKKPFITYKQ